MAVVSAEGTKCGTCGQPLNGGPVCTVLLNACAFVGRPEVVHYHHGTCCPGHRFEPARLPERSAMVEAAYRRAQDAAQRSAEGGE